MKKTGKAYYMISAVAQKYNIHPQTLRLYEREGLLKPSRTEGNTRLYSEEDLEQLETILTLTRDLGVNLAGVEVILNMRRKIQQMQGEVNEFMEYVKRELARGIDDWEQRLSTALVKSTSTDLVRANPSAASRHRDKKQAREKNTRAEKSSRYHLCVLPPVQNNEHLSALQRNRLEAVPGWRHRARDALRLLARRHLAAPHRRSAHSAALPPLHAQRLRHLRQRDARRGADAARARWPRNFRSSTRGLFFLGDPGVGKTHLAVAILKQVILTRGARGLFYDTRDLLKVIRGTYNNDVKTTELDVLRPVMEADLLVLDDLGAEKTSEWVEETLNLIVNTRYNERRATIFTSNYPGLAAGHRSGRHHAARSHRLPHALAAARDVRFRRSGGRRLPHAAPQRRRAGPEAQLGRAADARKTRAGRPQPSPGKGAASRRRQSRLEVVRWPRRLQRSNQVPDPHRRALRPRSVLQSHLQLLQLQSRPVRRSAEGAIR